MQLSRDLGLTYWTIHRLLKRGTADALRRREIAVQTGLNIVGVLV